MLSQLIDFSQLSDRYPLLAPLFLFVASLIGTDRIAVAWLLVEAVTILLFTYGIYLHYAPRANPLDVRAYLRFAFPRTAYVTRSTFLDVVMLLVNATLFRVTPVLRFAAALGIGYGIQRLLIRTFGPGAIEPSATGRVLLQISIAVVVYLVNDFSEFLTHLANHRIPALWAFHRVHHSGEVLTPLTAFREHPLVLIYTNTFAVVLGSLVQGLYLYFFPSVATLPLLLTGNLLTYILLRSNLLLSHYTVPISFGVVEKVFVSPMLHRVHHGRDPRYHDKNFGGRITLWDRLFKTFYVPTQEEALAIEVGIDGDEHLKTFNPLPLYWEPFVYAFKSLRRRKPAKTAAHGPAQSPATDPA